MVNSMKATEHWVSRKDGKVFYSKVGHGEPLILFPGAVGLCIMPGAEAGVLAQRKVNLANLSQHHTCYAVDPPGFGRSDVPTRRYAVEDLSDAVVDIMNDAGLKQAHTLGSHFGGIIMQNLAVRHPDRVMKMILDGSPYWSKEVGRTILERTWLPVRTDVTSCDIPVMPVVSFEEAKKRDPEWDREEWNEMHTLNPYRDPKDRRWVSIICDAITSYDAQAVGHKIKAPTLLVYTEGTGGNNRGADKINQAIKGSILKRVPHGSEATVQNQLIKLALDFLAAK